MIKKKRKLQHPEGFEVWVKITIPPCSGSHMHCNSDEWWARLQRSLRGEPAILAKEGVRPELNVEPGRLVLDRERWAGGYCQKCEKATVEVVVGPPPLAPRPMGQLPLL